MRRCHGIELWPIGNGYGTPVEWNSIRSRPRPARRKPELGISPRLRVGTPHRSSHRCASTTSTSRTGERTLLREQPVLGDYRREDYIERRDWGHGSMAPGIPISLIHRAGVETPLLQSQDGTAPTSRRRTRFSVARLSLLDRGMVFAIAHVRGGGELGGLWYEGGKLLEEEHLHRFRLRCKLSRREWRHEAAESWWPRGQRRRAVDGAVANLAPELFAGILAQVPFVDPLTTILDPSLPLTVTEWDEWGNPGQQGRVLLHEVVFALREHRGQALSGDSGHDVVQRHPGLVRRNRRNGLPHSGIQRSTLIRSCSRSRCPPVTAGSAGATSVEGSRFQYAWLLATADREIGRTAHETEPTRRLTSQRWTPPGHLAGHTSGMAGQHVCFGVRYPDETLEEVERFRPAWWNAACRSRFWSHRGAGRLPAESDVATVAWLAAR